jgi:hypothetical protein
MNPITIALAVIIFIYTFVFCALYILMIKNRGEKGKKEFWNLSYQFCYIWLISTELYNEKGNRYRKILIRTILIGLPLIISLGISLIIIADTTN